MSMLSWEERARKAEAALQLARAAIDASQRRNKVLQVLGNARANEWIDVLTVARRLGISPAHALRWLQRFEEDGWVERNRGFEAPRGDKSEWRLGYLVVVPVDEEIEA